MRVLYCRRCERGSGQLERRARGGDLDVDPATAPSKVRRADENDRMHAAQFGGEHRH